MAADDKLRILIPMDGSPTSEAVLPALRPLMQSQRIESTLFQVVDAAADGKAAEDRLGYLCKALEHQGFVARIHITGGRPAEEILRQAEQGSFDMIAMGTHGRSGLERVLIGSVAEEVMRGSPLPILYSRPDVETGNWSNIVVALDGTPGAEEILGDVVKIARAVKATVHLVRVQLSLLMINSYRGVSFEAAKDDYTSYLEQIAQRLTAQGVTAVVNCREGRPAEEITRLAKELDAGLVCMVTEGRTDAMPGQDVSVACRVIREAPCPVYVRHLAGERGYRH